MIIGQIKEDDNKETRTPLTPSTIKEITTLGHTVLSSKNIGKKSYYTNKEYIQSKSQILPNAQIYQQSDIIIKFTPPSQHLLKKLSKNQILISNFSNNEHLLSKTIATIIQLEKIPRTSFYQSIDTLTSQALPRGYSASLFALSKSPIIAPLLYTPSTSLGKAKALIIGASITGLEIASMFKKNGATTFILDVQPSAQELATSIGADFIHSTKDFDISSVLKDKDFILSAVNFHNPKNPPIITLQNLKHLKKGSILIDTTTNNISIKQAQKITSTYSFYRNPCFERLCPKTSSILFSSNMLNLIKLIQPFQDSSINLFPVKPMIYKN